MEQARNSPFRRVSVTMVYGRGPQGGRLRGGQRDYSAVNKLIAKGLLVEFRREKEAVPNHGYTAVFLTVMAKLPEAPQS
jgi:hypothetical protein